MRHHCEKDYEHDNSRITPEAPSRVAKAFLPANKPKRPGQRHRMDQNRAQYCYAAHRERHQDRDLLNLRHRFIANGRKSVPRTTRFLPAPEYIAWHNLLTNVLPVLANFDDNEGDIVGGGAMPPRRHAINNCLPHFRKCPLGR